MAGLGTALEQPAPDEDGEPATPEEQQLLDDFLNAVAEVIYPQAGQVSPKIAGNLQGGFEPVEMEPFQHAQPPVSGSPQDNVAMTAILLLITIDSKLGYQEKANAQGDNGQPAEPAPVQAPAAPPDAGAMPPAAGAPPGAMPAPPPAAAAPERLPMTPEGPEEPSYAIVLWTAGQQLIAMLMELSEHMKIHTFSEEEQSGVFNRAADLYNLASPNLDRKNMTGDFMDFAQAAQAGWKPGQSTRKILPGLPGGEPMPAPMPAQQGA